MPDPRQNEIAKLTSLAGIFRLAIEHTNRDRLPITFQKFPRGSCGDAALLLGAFLSDQGETGFKYVLGERNHGESWHSHAWIERKDIIVDITADQFPEISQAVIVTYSSVWHRQFAIEEHNMPSADYRDYDSYTVAVLGSAFRTIMKHIN